MRQMPRFPTFFHCSTVLDEGEDAKVPSRIRENHLRANSAGRELEGIRQTKREIAG